MFSWSNTLADLQSNSDQPVTLLPLPEYRLLLATGADSAQFLQGQCTCDTRELASNRRLQGAHCNPKGRMLSSFLMAQISSESIGLRLHQSIAEAAQAALAKYAVFSKTTLEVSEDYCVFALKGAESSLQQLIGDTFNITPELSEKNVISIENGLILSHSQSLVEVWLETSAASDNLKALAESASLVAPEQSQNLWNALMIEQGICEVQKPTLEMYLPQEMNFQLVDGVSFNKGCYTGQEIIARMHYKAQLKKHMYRGSVQSDSAPSANSKLLNDSNTAVGQILLSAETSENSWEFLALCKDEALESQSVVLDTDARPKISWQPLPYAIS